MFEDLYVYNVVQTELVGSRQIVGLEMPSAVLIISK